MQVQKLVVYLNKQNNNDMATHYFTTKELRKVKASDFNDLDTIRVTNAKSGEELYIINLSKGGYRGFMCSTVECAKTYDILNCTAGTKGGWPYYIANFIHE